MFASGVCAKASKVQSGPKTFVHDCSWKYAVDDFILKNLKLCFERGNKGKVINFL